MIPNELEMLFLGSALVHNGTFPAEEFNKLSPASFDGPAHPTIFLAMQQCLEKKITLNPANIAMQISEVKLEKIGGVEYLDLLYRYPAMIHVNDVSGIEEWIKEINFNARIRDVHTSLSRQLRGSLEDFQKWILESDNPEDKLNSIFRDLESKSFGSKEDGWKLISGDELFAPANPANFIVDEVLFIPSLSMLFGPPGSMKSMVLMDMALSVCAGRDWLKSDEYSGFETKESSVVWVILDSGKDSNTTRLQALSKKYEIEDKVKKNFHFLPFPKNPGFNAGDPKAIDRICAKIDSVGAKICVIDCLRKVGGGLDENNAEFDKVLSGLRDIADRTGTAVIFTHHTIKSNKGMYSGHHAIEGNLDLSFGITGEDNNVGLGIEGIREATLEWSKDRDGPYLGRKIGLQFSYFNKIVGKNSKRLSTGKFIQIDVPESDKKTEKKQDKRELAIEAIKATSIDGWSGEKIKQFIKDKAKIGDTIARDVLDLLNEEGYFTRVQRGRALLHYDTKNQPPAKEPDF